MSNSSDIPNIRVQAQEHAYQPAQWPLLYRQDIARYKSHRQDASTVRLLLTEQGLWALLQYRIASAIYRSRLPNLVKTPLLMLAIIWLKLIEMTTGISISYQARIGRGVLHWALRQYFCGRGRCHRSHLQYLARSDDWGIGTRREARHPTNWQPRLYRNQRSRCR
jgi:hypothetical protein